MTPVDDLAQLLLARRDLHIASGLIPANATRGLTDREVASAVDFALHETATTALATDAARLLLDARDRWSRRVVDELAAAGRRAGAGAIESQLAMLRTYGPAAHESGAAIARGVERRLTPILRTAATRGVEHFVAEAARQGVTLAPIALPGDITAWAATMAQVSIDEALRRAALSLGTLTLPDAPALEDIVAAIERHLRALPSRGVETDLARVPVEQSYGRGRMASMRAAATEHAATYYASELRDGASCISCSAIDGTNYTSLDVANLDYAPTYRFCAGGERCRGTLVAVFAEAV